MIQYIILPQSTFHALLTAVSLGATAQQSADSALSLVTTAEAQAALVIPGLAWTSKDIQNEVLAQGHTDDEVAAKNIALEILAEQDYRGATGLTEPLTREIENIVAEYCPTP